MNEQFAAIFKCADCNEEDQKDRGCAKPIKKGYVWEIPICIRCRGNDPDCELCKGSNTTKVSRCPCAIANTESSLLLPYFFDYYMSYKKQTSLQWPNGLGRAYQPARLKKAFGLLLEVAIKQEDMMRDQQGEGNKNG